MCNLYLNYAAIFCRPCIYPRYPSPPPCRPCIDPRYPSPPPVGHVLVPNIHLNQYANIASVCNSRCCVRSLRNQNRLRCRDLGGGLWVWLWERKFHRIHVFDVYRLVIRFIRDNSLVSLASIRLIETHFKARKSKFYSRVRTRAAACVRGRLTVLLTGGSTRCATGATATTRWTSRCSRSRTCTSRSARRRRCCSSTPRSCSRTGPSQRTSTT